MESFFAQKEQMFKNLLTSGKGHAIMKIQKRTDVLLDENNDFDIKVDNKEEEPCWVGTMMN